MQTTTYKQTTYKDLRFGGWDFIKISGDLELWGRHNEQRILYDPELGQIVERFTEKEEETEA